MQAFGKVPGEASLYRKDLVGPLSRNYVNLFKEAGRQDCLNTSRFFLPSYSLRVENECNEFFRIFNSQAYEEEKQREKIVYIKKVGANMHAGMGVVPLNDEQEEALRANYSFQSPAFEII